MKRLLACLCSALILTATSLSAAEITSISSAINKAGRQRMLTQRMLKAYTMIGISVQKEEAEKQLSSAIALFLHRC